MAIFNHQWLHVIHVFTDRCSVVKYDCAQRNPCIPRCVEGQNNYPGKWRNKYVTCDMYGDCFEKRCPPRTIWQQESERCVAKTYVYLFIANTVLVIYYAFCRTSSNNVPTSYVRGVTCNIVKLWGRCHSNVNRMSNYLWLKN